MNTESAELFENWWRRLNRKLVGKPQPAATLQRRTMNSVVAIMENLDGIPFDRLSMNLYFYCKDIKMSQFTRLYEAQIELAGAAPEKFAFGLHKFYTELANKIRKENLWDEFFEFYYRCARLRIEKLNSDLDGNVILAYLNLLTQHVEYLRPNKFNLRTCLVGRKTTGELMEAQDPYPDLDLPGYQFQIDYENNKIKGDPSEYLYSLYRQNGYEIRDEFDLARLTNSDKIQSTTQSVLLPFINEYTYDIIPKTPFSANTKELRDISTNASEEEIRTALKRRAKTLPTNGAVIEFSDNPAYKSILLKEILFDNSVYMLYRVTTTNDGDLCGFYDTRNPFFYGIMNEAPERPPIGPTFRSLVLYCYASLVCKDVSLAEFSHHFFSSSNKSITATCFMRGGKLKNVFDKQTEGDGFGEKRIGNDAYEEASRSIQGYIRRLPVGQKASDDAIAYAESLGYELEPGETFVRPFIKQVFRLKRVHEE